MRISSRLLAAVVVSAAVTACTSDGPSSPLAPRAPSAAKGGGTFSGGAPAPVPPGPLSGTWSGTLTYPSPLTTPYQVSLTIVQSGSGISGTFVQIPPAGDRPVTLDAAGSVGGGQVSLTLRPQKGKPGAQSTSYFGTLSADSSTMTLRGVTSGTVIVLSR